MATKPATPGTGFHAPLYLLDKDQEVIGTWSTGDVDAAATALAAVATALTAVTVDDTSATTLAAAVEAIIVALGGTVAE